MVNVFFALTEEFNSDGVIALLASGQAVVFYRIALMSKDGDWVLKETESACRRVRSDYPVIAELARLLPPQRERELTTDPDRILDLALEPGGDSARESARLARLGRSREEVVAALARESDRLQQADRARMQRYERAGQGYLAEFRATVPIEVPLEAP